MCGIVGIIGRLDRTHVDNVQAMMQAIKHRGPDGSGILALSGNGHICIKSADRLSVDLSRPEFDNPSVIFGHLRLAIVDLSPAALQPLSSAANKVWIIFNGEIYNYIELRNELIELGHSFQTHSDTEVVLEAYLEWGVRMLARLNGMFAFAISDCRTRKVFCARDRFGEKPFFFQIRENRFWFASEIKALMVSHSSPSANLNAVAKYLVNTDVHFGDETFFNGIRQLPASCYLEARWDEPEKYSIAKYYSLSETNLDFDRSMDFPTQFRERLACSVKLRMRADVPVGTCLSGGLDSSAVATLALQNLGTKDPEFHAFTAVPDVPGYSELEWAKTVVLDKHAVLHEVNVSAEDVRKNLDDFLLTQDEPVPTLSMFMQYRVMQAARANNIPVLLDGQGGDEILLGYERFYGIYVFQLLKEFRLGRASREFLQYSEHGLVSKRRLLGLVGYAHSSVRQYWRSRNRGRWLLPEIQELVGTASERFETIKEAQEYEVLVQPLPALLRFEDRNAMRFSVETRLPFLDHKLVEFCLQAPLETKLHDGWTKWMLRQSMDGIMPTQIAWRRDKKGFSAPDRVWLYGLKEQIHDLLASSPISSVLYQKKTPSQLFDFVLDRKPDLAWRVFCLERWLQLYKVGL